MKGWILPTPSLIDDGGHCNLYRDPAKCALSIAWQCRKAEGAIELDIEAPELLTSRNQYIPRGFCAHSTEASKICQRMEH